MWILLLIKRLRGASGLDAIGKGARIYRLVAYFGVLLFIGTFFTVRSARAEVLETSLQIGRDLLPIADLLGERNKLNIDGETAWVGSAITQAKMGEVLDRFAANCRESGVTKTAWEGLSAESELPKVDPTTFDPGVIRHEKGNEGVVLCFPQGEGASKSWFDRLIAFNETQDLGALGRVRYAFVRTDGEDAHVLTLWTGDHFRINKLAATDEYEPGSDNPNLPRPIRSRRTISASIEGTPYGVRGYLSMGTPRDIVNAYDAEMKERGFLSVNHGLEPERDVRGYLKDDMMVVLGTEPTDDGKTVVSLAEMGADKKQLNPLQVNSGVRIVD